MRDRVSLSPSAHRVQHAGEREAHLLLLLLLLLLLCVYNIGIAYNGRTYNVIHNPQAISHTYTNTQKEAHNERRRRHRTTFYRSFAAIKESNSKWESVLNLTQSLTQTHTHTHIQAYKYFMCKHCINISVCWYCFYCLSPTPSLTFSLPQLLLSKMSY